MVKMANMDKYDKFIANLSDTQINNLLDLHGVDASLSDLVRILILKDKLKSDDELFEDVKNFVIRTGSFSPVTPIKSAQNLRTPTFETFSGGVVELENLFKTIKTKTQPKEDSPGLGGQSTRATDLGTKI